ncbi:MAG TPA: hypothetical protein VLD67_15730 [Vicinamibacterales bacterium]|nr:hypothetical protein [Vicinamibacterales bacterium]
MFTVGVFQDVEWADRGLAALLADGFPPQVLTILAKSTPEAAALIAARLGSPGRDLDVEKLGRVVGTGSMLAALEGHDNRMASAGLAGAIGRAGFQAHDGYIFEKLVERGGVLVAVESEPRAADALAKLHAYGGGNAAIGAWSGRV